MPASDTSAIFLWTTEDLKAWLADKRAVTLIDTSIPEEFEVEHIPNARNACVFDMTFLDEVRALTSHSTTDSGSNHPHLVVYGTSARSLASATAAEKLVAAGFAPVHDYRGGLQEWRDAGEPTEGTHRPPSVPAVEDRVYAVDPAQSQVKWTGRNLTSAHSGTMRVSKGEITVVARRATRGEITLDMTSIENTDMEDPSLRALLAKNLFPTAQVSITSIDAIADAPQSSPTHRIHGHLTLKGVTKEVDFLAQIGMTVTGELIARADFDVDRTRWNVIYGSGKFYEKLGMHLVSDLISLDLKIVAR